MSQLILDDQLDMSEVLPPLPKWIKARRLCEQRPREKILDDRIPEILLTLKQPTFVTIDKQFWHRRWCNPNYCILVFAVRDDQQELIPGLLRALFRRQEFRTRARRMGKVARISAVSIDYWQFRVHARQRILWKGLN